MIKYKIQAILVAIAISGLLFFQNCSNKKFTSHVESTSDVEHLLGLEDRDALSQLDITSNYAAPIAAGQGLKNDSIDMGSTIADSSLSSSTSPLISASSTSVVQDACVPYMGENCSGRVAKGCPEDHGCAQLVGLYFNSPECGDDATVLREDLFDGTMAITRLKDSFYPEYPASRIFKIPDPNNINSRGICTEIGFTWRGRGSWGVPDGKCHRVQGLYNVSNLYTRVVPGTGCTYIEKSVRKVFQCDGSCR